MNNIFNEYEALWNRVQNLNLYMEYIRVNYPDAFEAAQKHFSGLPGFGNEESRD